MHEINSQNSTIRPQHSGPPLFLPPPGAFSFLQIVLCITMILFVRTPLNPLLLSSLITPKPINVMRYIFDESYLERRKKMKKNLGPSLFFFASFIALFYRYDQFNLILMIFKPLQVFSLCLFGPYCGLEKKKIEKTSLRKIDNRYI